MLEGSQALGCAVQEEALALVDLQNALLRVCFLRGCS